MTLVLPQSHHSYHLHNTILSISSHHNLLATLSIVYTDAYYLEVSVWLLLHGVHRIAHICVASLLAQYKQITANIQWSPDASRIYVFFNKLLITVGVTLPSVTSSYPSSAYFLHYLSDSDDAEPQQIALSLCDEVSLPPTTSMDLHDEILFGTDHASMYVLNLTSMSLRSIELMQENYMSHVKELHVPLFGASTTELSISSLHDIHTSSTDYIVQCFSCPELNLYSCLTNSGGISFIKKLSKNSYQSTPHIFIMSERKNFLFDHVIQSCHSYAHLICLSSSTQAENDMTTHTVDVLHYKCQYSEIALSLQLMWSTQLTMVASETIATRSQFVISNDNIVVLVDGTVFCVNSSGNLYAHYAFSNVTLADDHVLSLAIVLNNVVVTASSATSVHLDESPLLLPNSDSIDSTTHSEAPHRVHNGAMLQRRKSYPPSKRPVQKATKEYAPVDLSVASIAVTACTVQPPADAPVAVMTTSMFLMPLLASSEVDPGLLLLASQLRIRSLRLQQLHRQYCSNMYDIGPPLQTPPLDFISIPPLCLADIIHMSSASMLEWNAVSSVDHIAICCGVSSTTVVWFYSFYTKMWRRTLGAPQPISMNILNSDEYDITGETTAYTNRIVTMRWVSSDVLAIVANEGRSGRIYLISRISEKRHNVYYSKVHSYCALPFGISYADVLVCQDGIFVALGNDHKALIVEFLEKDVRIVEHVNIRASLRAVSHATHSVKQVMLCEGHSMALVLHSGLLVFIRRGSAAKIINDYAAPVQRIVKASRSHSPFSVVAIQSGSRYFLWMPLYYGQQTVFGTIVPMIQHQNSMLVEAFDINSALVLSYDYGDQHLALHSSIAVSLLLGLLNVTMEPITSSTLQHALLKHQVQTRLAPDGITIVTYILQSLSTTAITDLEYILYSIIAHQRQHELGLFISVVFAAHEELFLDIMSRLSRKLESSVNGSLYPLPNFSYGLSSPAKSPWTQILLFELCLTHKYVTFASRFLTATCEYYGGSDTPLSTVISLLLTTELAYICLAHGNVALALECLSFCGRLDLIALEHIASPVRLVSSSHPHPDIYSRALENVYSTFTLAGAQTLLSYMFGDDMNTLVSSEVLVPMVHLYNCSIANPDRVLQAVEEGVRIAQGSYTYTVMPNLQQRIFDTCVDASEDAKLENGLREDVVGSKQLLSYTEALLLHYFDVSVKNQQLCTATVAMHYLMKSSVSAPNGTHVVHHRMVNPLPIASPWNYAASTHTMLQHICKMFGFAMLKPVSVALSADGKMKKYSPLMLRRLCSTELSASDTLLVDSDEECVTLVSLLRSLLALSVVTQRMDIMLFVTLIFDRLDLALECWFRAANMQKLVDFCFGRQVSPVGVDYSNFSSSRTDVSQMKKIFHERNSMGLVDILHRIETLFKRDVPS